MKTVLWTTVVAACMLAAPERVQAQSAGPNGVPTIQSGVYTREQARRGQDTYAANCTSCHNIAAHVGPAFWTAWNGRTLWDLFAYISESMPKSDPGSLTEREYLQVMAYMLRVNGMPSGNAELPTDSTRLKRIRIESAPAQRSRAPGR